MNIEYTNTNQDEIDTCRICLEDDNIEKMISPCLCRGTNKYVHIDCLNQWRTLSYSDDSATKCPTCKFEYVLKNSDNKTNIIGNKINSILKNPSIIFCLNFFSIIIFVLLSYIFIDDEYEEEEIKFAEIISIFTLNFLYILLFIIYFFTLKNKRLFFNYYNHNNFLLLIFALIFFNCFITFTYTLIGFICFSLTMNLLSARHIKTLDLINNISNEEVISIEDESSLLNV